MAKEGGYGGSTYRVTTLVNTNDSSMNRIFIDADYFAYDDSVIAKDSKNRNYSLGRMTLGLNYANNCPIRESGNGPYIEQPGYYLGHKSVDFIGIISSNPQPYSVPKFNVRPFTFLDGLRVGEQMIIQSKS